MKNEDCQVVALIAATTKKIETKNTNQSQHPLEKSIDLQRIKRKRVGKEEGRQIAGKIVMQREENLQIAAKMGIKNLQKRQLIVH